MCEKGVSFQFIFSATFELDVKGGSNVSVALLKTKNWCQIHFIHCLCHKFRLYFIFDKVFVELIVLRQMNI